MHQGAYEEYKVESLIFNRNRINCTIECWQLILEITSYDRGRILTIHDHHQTKNVFVLIFPHRCKRMYAEATCRLHIETPPRTSKMFGSRLLGMMGCMSMVHVTRHCRLIVFETSVNGTEAMRPMMQLRVEFLKLALFGHLLV